MSIEIVWISPAWKAGRLHRGKMDWYSVDLNDSLRGAFEEISLNSSCVKPHIVFWLTFQSVLYFCSSCLERFQWKVAGISSVFVSEVFAHIDAVRAWTQYWYTQHLCPEPLPQTKNPILQFSLKHYG